jgi:hypothetical protein
MVTEICKKLDILIPFYEKYPLDGWSLKKGRNYPPYYNNRVEIIKQTITILDGPQLTRIQLEFWMHELRRFSPISLIDALEECIRFKAGLVPAETAIILIDEDIARKKKHTA